MKPKLAVVVQRYGKDVLGGSEQHARKVVKMLQTDYHVTVITTTAHDYLTWANYYEPGESREQEMKIVRFPVRTERNMEDFNQYSEYFFSSKNHTKEEENEWFKRQGPYCPELIEYIRNSKANYDCFIFFTYLYYTTIYGLPPVGEKSLLIPTAHNEPPFYLDAVKTVLSASKGFILNTDVERELIFRVHPESCKNYIIAGIFVEKANLPESRKNRSPLTDRYLLYFGRLEKGKGILELMDYFALLLSNNPDLKLVCLGRNDGSLKPRNNILFPGYVSELEKTRYLENAEFIVIPSAMESLSMTLLESLLAGKPVVVNGKSDVMVDHCRKSNGGLWYEDYNEFVSAAEFLLKSHEIRKQMGKNGQKYVQKYYSPDRIRKVYDAMIEFVLGDEEKFNKLSQALT